MIGSVLKAGIKPFLPAAVRVRLKNWLKATSRDILGADLRLALSAQFISGAGIEIGALNQPLPVVGKARVRYVDRITVAEARRHLPELIGLPFVEPDILTDGEKLAGVPDRSQDFVIANHFVEHAQDPIDTLGNFVRVLMPGGILFLGLPDKRYTFDRDRPETPYEHLLEDHASGPEGSRNTHFEEWVRYVEGISEPQRVRTRVVELMDMGYSIHFHVWTPAGALEFFERTFKRLAISYEMLTMTLNPALCEVIFVFKIGDVSAIASSGGQLRQRPS